MGLESFNSIDGRSQKWIISGFLLGGLIFTVGIIAGNSLRISGAGIMVLSILHYLAIKGE